MSINTERLVQNFLKYVRISSPSRSEAKFAAVLIEDLKALGAAVEVDQSCAQTGSNTGNVIAHLAGTLPVAPILLSAHMDTVTPAENIQPVIRDGVIYSDGSTILSADDKAGIAAIIEALTVLKEQGSPHGPVEIAFSVCEEVGLLGAKFLDFSKFKSKTAFVFDGSIAPGAVVVTAPYQDKIEVTVSGRAAHAGGAPEQGISAIMVAAEAISQMKLLRIDAETTANIGIISGGSATNIVCPEVKIAAEARSRSEEKLNRQTGHMGDCFRKAAERSGARVDITVGRSYQGYTIADDDAAIALIERADQNAGLTSGKFPTGGGSDANIFNTHGIKSLVVGEGYHQVHTTSEHIAIADLVNTARFAVELIKAAAN